VKLSLFGPLVVITLMIALPRQTAVVEAKSDTAASNRATLRISFAEPRNGKIVNAAVSYDSVAFNRLQHRAPSTD
jgi:hypothetical protein